MNSRYLRKPIGITQNGRLSFAEQDYVCLIWQLSQAEGFCSASNGWFSTYFCVTKQRVSVIVGSLAAKKIIAVELERSGKRVIGRTLKIIDEGINKALIGCQQSVDRGYQRFSKEGINDLAKEERKGKRVRTERTNTVSRDTRVSFDSATGEFFGITEADLNRWQKAYPGVSHLQTEIALAADWLVRKNEVRSDYRLYLTGWFRRVKPGQITPAPTGGIDNLPPGDTQGILSKLGWPQAEIDKFIDEGNSL